jgi:hypothetical protein
MKRGPDLAALHQASPLGTAVHTSNLKTDTTISSKPESLSHETRDEEMKITAL